MQYTARAFLFVILWKLCEKIQGLVWKSAIKWTLNIREESENIVEDDEMMSGEFK